MRFSYVTVAMNVKTINVQGTKEGAAFIGSTPTLTAALRQHQCDSATATATF